MEFVNRKRVKLECESSLTQPSVVDLLVDVYKPRTCKDIIGQQGE